MAMKEPPSSAEAGVGWDALVADAELRWPTPQAEVLTLGDGVPPGMPHPDAYEHGLVAPPRPTSPGSVEQLA